MKKLLFVLVSVFGASVLLGFIIIFEGNFAKVAIWWKQITRNSDWISYSPYKERRVESDRLHFEDPNNIVFIDKHLFWKGTGAFAEPELSEDNVLLKINLKEVFCCHQRLITLYIIIFKILFQVQALQWSMLELIKFNILKMLIFTSKDCN